LRGWPHQLRQILICLITNAIRHSGKAKVRINLDYLHRISFFGDLRLIFLTIWPARLVHPERERVEQALKKPV